jgi:multidrug efflux system membrane fusion protein
VLVKEGNLVRGSGADPLVVINQLAPIRVRFSLPAADLARIRQRASAHLRVEATPVGDSTTIAAGDLNFLDNAVDTLTGTIQLKGTFENKDHLLWPGELVRVRLQLDVERNALVVPQPAILTGQKGTSLFVVDDGKAGLKKDSVFRTSDSIAVLSGGIEPGEKVVVDGQLRLTDVAKVIVRGGEKVQP